MKDAIKFLVVTTVLNWLVGHVVTVIILALYVGYKVFTIYTTHVITEMDALKLEIQQLKNKE